MAFLTVFHLCQADRLENVIKKPWAPGEKIPVLSSQNLALSHFCTF